MGMSTIGTHGETHSTDKITRIREKIEVVFGRPSTWDDLTISKRYNLTDDGDLIMILR